MDNADAVSLAQLRAAVSLQAEGLSKWQQKMLSGMLLHCSRKELPYYIGKANQRDLESLLVVCAEIKRAADTDAKVREALGKISAAMPSESAAVPVAVPGTIGTYPTPQVCHGQSHNLGVQLGASYRADGEGQVVCFRANCACEFSHVAKK